MKRRPSSGNSSIARLSTSEETALDWVSTKGGSLETVICSLAPPTCSLNSSSRVAPTEMCNLGVSCGDMSGATARAVYSPGGSNSNTNCPSESLVTK